MKVLPQWSGGLAAGAGSLTRRIGPGLTLAAALAAAALAAERLTGWPAMLFALAFGMAAHRLTRAPAAAPGVGFASRSVLRLGVILIGAGVTAGEIRALGGGAIATAAASTAITLTLGWSIGRWCGLSRSHAVLSAGATAICGASAALAIAAVLPRERDSERNLILTIAGVTAMSTLVMVLYPAIALKAGFDARQAGVFLGASIHDVAQVMGAGFILSPDVAETAGVTKLARVALLAPAVIFIAWRLRRSNAAQNGPAPLPLFLLGFAALVLANSLGLIPGVVQEALVHASRLCLVVAVAAIGLKAAPGALIAAGPRPALALTLQTALIALIAFAGAALTV